MLGAMLSHGRIKPVTSSEFAQRSTGGSNLSSFLTRLSADASRATKQRDVAKAILASVYSTMSAQIDRTDLDRMKDDDVGHVCTRMADLGVTDRMALHYLQVFFGRFKRAENKAKAGRFGGRRALILDDNAQANTPIWFSDPESYGGWEHLATIRDLHTDIDTRFVAKCMLLLLATERLSMRCYQYIHDLDAWDCQALVGQGRADNIDLEALRALLERSAR